jgi:hypothetical protein
MTYEQFLKTLLNYRQFSENAHELYQVGVDLHEGKYAIIDQVDSLLYTATPCLSKAFTMMERTGTAGGRPDIVAGQHSGAGSQNPSQMAPVFKGVAVALG